MPQNDHRPRRRRVGTRLSRCLFGGVLAAFCGSVALGQSSGTGPDAARPQIADDTLKACLQRHYEAGHEVMAVYRSGAELVAACRNEWDGARFACAAQPGRTPQTCDARAQMMLLGFVPMH